MLCFSSAISGGSRGRAAPGRPVCPPSPHVPRSPGAPARPCPSPSSWSGFSSPCLLPPTPSSSVCPSACSHRASSHDRAASLCDVTPAPCGSSKAVPRAWARGHPLLGPSHALRDPPGRRYFLWPVPSPRARSRLGPVPRSAGRRQGEQGVSQSSRC